MPGRMWEGGWGLEGAAVGGACLRSSCFSTLVPPCGVSGQFQKLRFWLPVYNMGVLMLAPGGPTPDFTSGSVNAQFWDLPILEKPPPPRPLGRGWPGLGHILVTTAPVAHWPTACSEGKAVWQVLGRVPAASPPPGDILVSPRNSLTPCWSTVEVGSQFRV